MPLNIFQIGKSSKKWNLGFPPVNLAKLLTITWWKSSGQCFFKNKKNSFFPECHQKRRCLWIISEWKTISLTLSLFIDPLKEYIWNRLYLSCFVLQRPTTMREPTGTSGPAPPSRPGRWRSSRMPTKPVQNLPGWVWYRTIKIFLFSCGLSLVRCHFLHRNFLTFDKTREK